MFPESFVYLAESIGSLWTRSPWIIADKCLAFYVPHLSWNLGWYTNVHLNSTFTPHTCIVQNYVHLIDQRRQKLETDNPIVQIFFTAFRCNKKAWLIFWDSIFFDSLYIKNEIPWSNKTWSLKNVIPEVRVIINLRSPPPPIHTTAG